MMATDPLASSKSSEASPSASPPNDPGLTLCLSGGGFRATLFHLGALLRLNELGVLSRIKVITSVSGGSILNGVLATRWAELRPGEHGVFENFRAVVAGAVHEFCAKDLRTRLLFGPGRLSPRYLGVTLLNRGSVPANLLAERYEELLQSKALSDLPAPGGGAPRFVFCATSMQTGGCWHFHGGPNGKMGDFYTGYFPVAGVPLSMAVASSSAFPPGFGAYRWTWPAGAGPDRVDPWGVRRPGSAKGRGLPDRAATKRLVLLTDGGVYDNLGVEPVWDTARDLIVSNAGKPFGSLAVPNQGAVSRLGRAYDISAEQVGAVRQRWLIERFSLGGAEATGSARPARHGALWTINTRPNDFPRDPGSAEPPPCYDPDTRRRLADVRTDLNAFETGETACLENFGYWLADAALHSYGSTRYCARPDAPFTWPHPEFSADKDALAALAESDKRHIPRDIWRMLRRR